MNGWKWLGIMGVGIILIYPFVAAATTAKTTFTFNVPTSRGITATYGGNCSATAFFFNEADANFDPDTDGNDARVKPSPNRRTDSQAFALYDHNFVGITSPSTSNIAYAGNIAGKPFATNATPSGEINTAGYGFIEADDVGTISRTATTTGTYPSFRFVFKQNFNKQYIADFNFSVIGSSQKAIDLQACASNIMDLNAYIWNYTTSAYQHLAGVTGGSPGEGGQRFSASVIHSIPQAVIQNYVGDDGNVVILVQGVAADAQGDACGFIDFAELVVTYFSVRPDFCQSSTMAPITISNVGNVDVNIDGNFSSAFSGVDINLVLKAWQGSGSGCGADGNGLGGWQRDCNVTTHNPEAWWNMEDGNGTTVTDTSGNNHHGTRQGSQSWSGSSECYAGNCLFFAQDGNVEIANGITFLDHNFSITTWVHIKSTQSGTTRLVSTYDGNAGKMVDLNYEASTLTLNCQAGTRAVSGGVDIQDGWHHLACTRVTSGLAYLYLDGSPIENGTVTSGDLDLSANSFLRLGSNLNGWMDITQIYTRALSDTEIADLYNSGAAAAATPDNWQTNEPGQTYCRQYDNSNATTGARLDTNLTVGASQQFCFSGELTGGVREGDHNKTYQIGSEFS